MKIPLIIAIGFGNQCLYPFCSKNMSKIFPLSRPFAASSYNHIISSPQNEKKFPFNLEQIKILENSLLKRTRGQLSVKDLLSNKKGFEDYILSDPYQLAYYLAVANPDLYALCRSDDLLTINGGNSWRKGGAVKVSKFLKHIELLLEEDEFL